MSLKTLITGYLFVSQEPEKADVILIPGSPFAEPAQRAALLYNRHYAPWLVASGNRWIFHSRKNNALTECDSMVDIVMGSGVPRSAILREDRARHTLENARLSRIALDKAGVTVKTAIICCQSFHARRCYKSYSRYFKGVELLICPVPTRGVDASNWHKSPVGVFKVMTELLKCTGLFFFLISFLKSK
jgi:uncharacterized SAM-binding protein YcdF (DUF218 family)